MTSAGTDRVLPRWIVLTSIAAFVIGSLYFSLIGPRVENAGGLGWDGQDFGPMAQDLKEAVTSGKIPTYRLVRFVPSVVVGGASRLLGNPSPGPADLANDFAIANLILVLGSAALWRRIARLSEFPGWVSWLGFLFLFCNYAMVRAPYFDAVMTDYFGLFLAMLSLDSYLRGRTAMLAASTVAGAFTWPILFFVNGAMLVMPVRPAEAERETAPVPDAPRVADRLARAAAVCVFVALSIHFIYFDPIPLPYGAEQIVRPLLPVSMACALAYVIWVARCMSFLPLARKSNFDTRGAAILLLSLLMYSLVHEYLVRASGNDTALNSPAMMLQFMSTQSLVRPGSFVLAHVCYWGAWVLPFVMWLKPVFEASRRWPAIYLLVAVSSVFFIFTESRYAMCFLPVVVFAFCNVLARGRAPPAKVLAALLLVTLIGSRFWLPMSRAGEFDALLQFPAQWYFMNNGPWMGWGGYWFNFAQVLICAAILLARGKAFHRPGFVPVGSIL